MKGGSLTRYHSPQVKGGDFTKELIKIAGPTIVQSASHALDVMQKGATVSQALSQSRTQLRKGLKRKLPAVAGLALKTAGKQGYKRTVKRARDILGF